MNELDQSTRIAVLEARVDDFKESLMQVQSSISRVTEELTKLNTRLSVQEEKFASLADKISQVSRQVDDVGERILKNTPSWRTYIAIGAVAVGGTGALELVKGILSLG
jgi:chromosome segregation ATPase